MAIYKSKHAGNYTVVSNSVFKQNLSLEAIGLLTYLLSLPCDWVIYKTQLHEKLNIGREKFGKIFKELQESGYILTIKKRSLGKIEYEHIVYDLPYNGEPLTEKPYTEKPLTVNRALLSTNITKETNTKEINTKDIYAKKNDFLEKCKNELKNENDNMLNEFVEYWTESNKKNKLRYEAEPFFDIKRRFDTWKRNAAKYLVDIPKRKINQF